MHTHPHLCVYTLTCVCLHTHAHTPVHAIHLLTCECAHVLTCTHASVFYFSEATANSEQTQVRCVLTKSGYSWSHLSSTLPEKRGVLPGRRHTLRKKAVVLSTPVKEPCGVGTGSRELGGCTRLVITGLLSPLTQLPCLLPPPESPILTTRPH